MGCILRQLLLTIPCLTLVSWAVSAHECPYVDVEKLMTTKGQGGIIMAEGGSEWAVEWLDENPWEKPFTDVGRTLIPIERVMSSGGKSGWKAPTQADPLQTNRHGIWCDNYYAFTDFSFDAVKEQNEENESKLDERVRKADPKAYKTLMKLREKHQKIMENIDVSSLGIAADIEKQIDKIERKYRIYDKGYKAFALKLVNVKTHFNTDVKKVNANPSLKPEAPQANLGPLHVPSRAQPAPVVQNRLTPQKPVPPTKQVKPMISLGHPNNNVLRPHLPQREKSNLGEYSPVKTSPKKREVLREIKIGFLITTSQNFTVGTPYELEINGRKWGTLASGTYISNQRIDLHSLPIYEEMDLSFVLQKGKNKVECRKAFTEQSGKKVQSFRVEIKSDGGKTSCGVIYR